MTAINIILALALGILAYFLAHLVFNDPISFIIGIVVGILVLFGDGYRRGRIG